MKVQGQNEKKIRLKVTGHYKRRGTGRHAWMEPSCEKKGKKSSCTDDAWEAQRLWQDTRSGRWQGQSDAVQVQARKRNPSQAEAREDDGLQLHRWLHQLGVWIWSSFSFFKHAPTNNGWRNEGQYLPRGKVCRTGPGKPTQTVIRTM